MKNINRWLAMAAVACVSVCTSNKVMAQPGGGGGGGFDPARIAEFQQRRMDDLREQLELKDDGDWKAIQPLIQKVMDSQRSVLRDRMGGGMFGRRRGGDNNGGGNGGGGNADNNGGRRRGGGFGGEPSPEVEALQKAIDSKASNTEMKAALAKVQEARKTHQADLEKAQADLKKVL